MRFTLPKPLHGWRGFAGEVGIIVLGVLIALGANAAFEQWNWRREAADAQRDIDAELAQNAGVFDERLIQADCLEERRQQALVILKEARRTGRIGDVRGQFGGSIRPTVTAAWDAAVADGTVSHLDPDRRADLGIVYPVIANYRKELEQEMMLWTQLRVLNNAPGPISDALLAMAYSAALQLGHRARLDTIDAKDQMRVITAMGIKPDYYLITDDHSGSHDQLLKQHREAEQSNDRCQPVTVDGKPVVIPPANPR